MPKSPHDPVLVNQVIELLKPRNGDSLLDLTAGYGGHASAIIDLTGNDTESVLVDRDPEAVAFLRERFKGRLVDIRLSDFLSASLELSAQGRQFDLILADLGVSSPHLNTASRGFSFMVDGPLDMRMDSRQELTASIIVNNYSEAALADLIHRYGEEPKARQIAKLIVRSRPLKTTRELANVVARAWPVRSRVHPATRTFQALRIVVNDELRQLEKVLPVWCDQLLGDGGRLAVISFHSLEDRLVKQALNQRSRDAYSASLSLLTKKPIRADRHETVFYPRARSAKLRAAAKIKRKGS